MSKDMYMPLIVIYFQMDFEAHFPQVFADLAPADLRRLSKNILEHSALIGTDPFLMFVLICLICGVFNLRKSAGHFCKLRLRVTSSDDPSEAAFLFYLSQATK